MAAIHENRYAHNEENGRVRKINTREDKEIMLKAATKPKYTLSIFSVMLSYSYALCMC